MYESVFLGYMRKYLFSPEREYMTDQSKDMTEVQLQKILNL